MRIFKEAQVDLVNVVTLSSLTEALGVARAAQESDIDCCTIGFVLNEEGMLLDGTPLHEAIKTIDFETTIKPLGYLVTCTHSSILLKLVEFHDEYKRLIGIQANGSSLSPKKLAAMAQSVADSPEQFSKELMKVKKQFDLRIVGGCCGTSREHLVAIAQVCKSTPTRS